MKICLAGAGAFGIKHLEALANIDDVEIVSLVGRTREPTEEVARKYGIPRVATDLAEPLASSDIDAVILATPTQLHASQAIACPIPAGGCTIHHNRTMHYAGANRSDIPRRALILGFGIKPQPYPGEPRDFYWNKLKQTPRSAREERAKASVTKP